MTSDQENKKFKIAITYDRTGGAVAVDGKIIGSHEGPPKPKSVNIRTPRNPLNPSIFSGPKLKVERAKKHIAELEALLQTFHQSNPYELVLNQDAKTGENGDDANLTLMEAMERNKIIEVLKDTGGNKLETARRLGIGRQTLYNKIKSYAIAA